ncbi:MAG TPA: SMP-30/gluconolactonase/LRE family protein [Pararhizobium sp.]|nr:SMP-30/gluconolactonase/LRE family protein [Pararhizobium sp.]
MAETEGAFAGRQIGNAVFTLGEGVTYDPATDTAWWFDILERKLAEYAFATEKMTVHNLPMMASALAVIDDSRHMILSEDGLCVRDAKSGTLSRYMDIESDNSVTRSNDARVHSCGAFWVSTMGKNVEDKAGSIYHVFKGKLTPLYRDVTIPNAICFSPDGSVGYYTDTRVGEVMRVSLDPKTGLPNGEPALFLQKDSGPGVPDGSIIDLDANMWNARNGAGCIDCYSPEGRRLKSLGLPAKKVTCPAFVGTNADRLLVTSAHQQMDTAARQAEPLAGATFLLDEPVRGKSEPRMVL